MSTTKKILTNKFRVQSANAFSSSFDFENYYMFVGRHIPYDQTDSNIPDPSDNNESLTDLYDNMIFAKRIDQTDTIQLIRKILWQENTVYDEYDHRDENIYLKNFYVVVDDTSEFNVFKCLSNNNGAKSTASPFRVGNSTDLEPFITADGYIWKYMFTVDKLTYETFSTKTLIPVQANNTVIDNAIPGTIDVIKVIDGGSGYDNYLENITFRSSDIKMGGSETIYGAPTNAASINDFYKGCVLKITSGTGSNQYRKIIAYEGSAAQKRFILDSPFSVTPSQNDTYSVYPYIYVWGDGNETVPAEGMGIVDPVANSIASVEILNAGQGYRSGEITPGTAYINNINQLQMSDVILYDVNFNQANLVPIISPSYGHGANPWEELGSTYVGISTKFSGTENDLFSTQNEYRQVGLIKNPEYNSVTLSLSDTNGSFSVGETLYQYKSIKLFGTVSADANSNIIEKQDIGKISNNVTILNAGTGYDSTANNQLVFNNTGTGGTGAAGTFANNGSGEITSVTITNQGFGYTTPPVVTINGLAGGSSAQLVAKLANPEVLEFDDSLEPGDLISIEDSNSRFISSVVRTDNSETILVSSNTTQSYSNAHVSIIETEASGIVTSLSAGQVVLTNVKGVFEEDRKILGQTSGASSRIATSNTSFNAIKINNRNAYGFNSSRQLYSLVGNYSVGANQFIENEVVEQELVVPLGRGTGFLHHIEINPGSDDDVVYITNKSGNFYLDVSNDKPIKGLSSGAILEKLSNKYSGEFVQDSGSILYYENLRPITRASNKSEIIKIVISF